MWTTEVTYETIAKREKIWELWADVLNWKIWDKEVESADLFGKFQKGTKGILKPKDGPKAKFEITELTKLNSFTSRSFLPLCTMDFVHSISEAKNGILITHKIIMTGFMAFLFSKVIGSKIKAGLPVAVEALIELAEKN